MKLTHSDPYTRRKAVDVMETQQGEINHKRRFVGARTGASKWIKGARGGQGMGETMRKVKV